jgi:Flp pilus assembly protein TadG
MYDTTLDLCVLYKHAHRISETLHKPEEYEGPAVSDCGNATRGTTERGQVVVEYALVGIVLFLFLLGLIDFGRAVWIYSSVSTAAREGARYAMVRGYECLRQQFCTPGSETQATAITSCNTPSPSSVVAKACSYLVGIDPARARVEVTLPLGGNHPGQSVRVRVEVDYMPLTVLIFRSVGQMKLTSISEQIITF